MRLIVTFSPQKTDTIVLQMAAKQKTQNIEPKHKVEKLKNDEEKSRNNQ